MTWECLAAWAVIAAPYVLIGTLIAVWVVVLGAMLHAAICRHGFRWVARQCGLGVALMVGVLGVVVVAETYLKPSGQRLDAWARRVVSTCPETHR